jgi:hypothetical protein
LMWPPVLFMKIKLLLIEILLPVGYPGSVCPEYVAFRVWTCVHTAVSFFADII